MDKDYLILKRASASRLSGKWSEDDSDVLADGLVVGRILKAAAAPVGTPWLWTLAFGHHEDRTPIYVRQELAAGVRTCLHSGAKPNYDNAKTNLG